MFGFLKKKKTPEEMVLEILQEIKAETVRNSVLLKISDEVPGLSNSKLGGIPYWTAEKEFPVDGSGRKMQLLAQINFAEVSNSLKEAEKAVPSFESQKCEVTLESQMAGSVSESQKCEGLPEDFASLPESGILQFFIPASGTNFGLDVSKPVMNPDFKMIFHEKVDETITENDVLKFLGNYSVDDDSSPIKRPVKLAAEMEESVIQEMDADFDEVFKRTFEKVSGIKMDGEPCEMLDDEAFGKGRRFSGEFSKALKKRGSRILGHPYFCQGDIRGMNEQWSGKIFDTLLLQLDSIGSNDAVEFGDGGIAQIFINSEDLKKRNFSKVLYNWDCD